MCTKSLPIFGLNSGSEIGSDLMTQNGDLLCVACQVEQVRQSRLETEAFKEQLAQAKQQLANQASTLHQLQHQHQQLLQQVCEQRQRALAEPAEQMRQHEGAALEQVLCMLCCAVLCCAVLCSVSVGRFASLRGQATD